MLIVIDNSQTNKVLQANEKRLILMRSFILTISIALCNFVGHSTFGGSMVKYLVTLILFLSKGP